MTSFEDIVQLSSRSNLIIKTQTEKLLSLGSGCGSVGRAVASYTRGLQFVYFHSILPWFDYFELCPSTFKYPFDFEAFIISQNPDFGENLELLNRTKWSLSSIKRERERVNFGKSQTLKLPMGEQFYLFIKLWKPQTKATWTIPIKLVRHILLTVTIVFIAYLFYSVNSFA